MTRTRFSFCPKKSITIEDLRNALFAYLIAKHDNGEFILRIEDANQNGYTKTWETIENILSFFEINYDEGPQKEKEDISYFQSKRLSIYKSYADKLIKRGKSYYCFCSKEELNRKRLEATVNKTSYLYDRTCRNFPKDEARRKILIEENYVIRFAMPKEGQTSFRDRVYGDITTKSEAWDDLILIKSDGKPTFNFASVIDDALMNITHVTNSIKLLPNVPKFLSLYEALGFPVPEFIHIPRIIIEKEDALTDLLCQGFLKEALLNYIVLLGWNPKSTNEFFTLEELVQEFDVKNIKKRPAHFDIKKLEWFNRHYIKQLSEEEYLNYVRPYLEHFYNVKDKNEEWIRNLLLLYKNRLNFASEIGLYAHMFFTHEMELEKECISYLKSEVSILNTLRIFKSEVENTTIWNIEKIKEILENTKEKNKVNGKLLYMPIRVAITGIMQGPNLMDCLYLLGKETILERLN